MEKYIYLICPFGTLIICCLIKNLIEMIQNKKIDIKRIFDASGGMPSCHVSFISSLITLIGIKLGFDSPLFALGIVLTLIVAYDAIGIRYECGLHAEIINNWMRENNSNQKLKEKIGHKKNEVLAGLILGIIMGILFSYV